MRAADKSSPTKWPKRPTPTGVRLPKELVTAAKHRALDQGLTLRELVERALREYVRKQS